MYTTIYTSSTTYVVIINYSTIHTTIHNYLTTYTFIYLYTTIQPHIQLLYVTIKLYLHSHIKLFNHMLHTTIQLPTVLQCYYSATYKYSPFYTTICHYAIAYTAVYNYLTTFNDYSACTV